MEFLTFENGDVYYGEIADNKPHGIGVIFLNGGDIVEKRKWENGKPLELLGRRTYGGGRINLFAMMPEFKDYGFEDLPVIVSWFEQVDKQVDKFYQLEGKWSKQLLEDSLKDNFMGAIDKSDMNNFCMSENLPDLEVEDFFDAFKKYAADNKREGKSGNNILGFVTVQMKPLPSGMSRLSEIEKKLKE